MLSRIGHLEKLIGNITTSLRYPEEMELASQLLSTTCIQDLGGI